MFLAVLGAATVLEGVVSLAVLRPLAAQRGRDRAELALDRAARRIAALPDPYDLAELTTVLRELRPGDRGEFLALSAWDGRLVPGRPLAPGEGPRIVDLLVRSGLADSLAAHAAMRAVDSTAVETERGEPAFELIGHRTVTIDSRRFGDVVALGAPARANLWSLPESRTLLLSLPFAVLASAAAGLLMVRILVRRLRALESVAARVTQGDLDARIEPRGADEIARLERSIQLMTDRLKAARDQLERTDTERRRLLADLTHELATPLTSIRGFVQTLLDPKVSTTGEERTAYLENALHEAERLDHLVSEMVELTRLEVGATQLRLERLDWMALCRNTTRRFASRFAEAGLSCHWTGPEDPVWVRADGRRLEQVIENLLTNALRYVPSGGAVKLSIEREPGFAALRVSDDGPGLSKEDLPHLFERFYRAETARDLGGTGLGLAIVREIVLRHGGEVHAEGGDSRGVTFVVTLPAEP